MEEDVRVANITDLGSDWKELHPNAVYIGRSNLRMGLPASPLANPYKIGKHTREEVIGMYRDWLWSQIKAKNPRVMQALDSLTEDSILVCWCHPKPCHGEVVIRAWNWLKSQ